MLTGSVITLNDDIIEYDIRFERGGWTIYNIITQQPAIFRGVRMFLLLLNEADEILDLLNVMESNKPGSSVTWADGSR
ncbi:hypothetical protein [Methylobacterium sp. CM6247]